jgi:hypothetical protein
VEETALMARPKSDPIKNMNELLDYLKSYPADVFPSNRQFVRDGKGGLYQRLRRDLERTNEGPMRKLAERLGRSMQYGGGLRKAAPKLSETDKLDLTSMSSKSRSRFKRGRALARDRRYCQRTEQKLAAQLAALQEQRHEVEEMLAITAVSVMEQHLVSVPLAAAEMRLSADELKEIIRVRGPKLLGPDDQPAGRSEDPRGE